MYLFSVKLLTCLAHRRHFNVSKQIHIKVRAAILTTDFNVIVVTLILRNKMSL